MNHKFNIGQKVMVKFNSKWTSGRVESIQQKGMKLFYFISVEGAKNFKKVTEDEIW